MGEGEPGLGRVAGPWSRLTVPFFSLWIRGPRCGGWPSPLGFLSPELNIPAGGPRTRGAGRSLGTPSSVKGEAEGEADREQAAAGGRLESPSSSRVPGTVSDPAANTIVNSHLCLLSAHYPPPPGPSPLGALRGPSQGTVPSSLCVGCSGAGAPRWGPAARGRAAGRSQGSPAVCKAGLQGPGVLPAHCLRLKVPTTKWPGPQIRQRRL